MCVNILKKDTMNILDLFLASVSRFGKKSATKDQGEYLWLTIKNIYQASRSRAV